MRQSKVSSFPKKASFLGCVLPTSLGGSGAGCKSLAGLWPRWLIVCRGLEGVSLAPGICQDFNFMQMEVGRKCGDAGTCKPSRVLE